MFFVENIITKELLNVMSLTRIFAIENEIFATDFDNEEHKIAEFKDARLAEIFMTELKNEMYHKRIFQGND